MYLYHYYDKSQPPFTNLSELPYDEAKRVMERIKAEKPNTQCAMRNDKYVEYRHNCERIIRTKFIEKGGIVERESPHYMVIGHSPWLSTWFENCAFIKIPIEEFDTGKLSFTYGDSMPTFGNPAIKREYHNHLYTYDEILEVINKFGLPQDWNDDGSHGYERYVEVHVWSDETIDRYR